MQAVFNINTPTSVHFGPGASKALMSVLPKHVDAVVLVRGASGKPSVTIKEILDQQRVQIHEVLVSSEPTVASVNQALEDAVGKPCSAIIACGGGSVLDTAKALRLCLELGTEIPDDFRNIDPDSLGADGSIPLVAVPTTAGTGAEVTSNAVLGTANSKVSIRGRRLFPTTALVDPTLLASAPKSVTIGSGLDAVTQTIEAYTSRQATPFTSAITKPNIRLGAQVLRATLERGDQEAWVQMAWVSLSSGIALANGGLGAAHGLAAVLSGKMNAPHGLLCGRLLGPVLSKNRSTAEIGSDTFRRLEYCIEVLFEIFPMAQGHDELSGFNAWLKQQRVPRLRDYCPDRRGFDEIAEKAVFASSSTKNAVPLKKDDFREILDAAY